MLSPLNKLHTWIHQSQDPDAKYSPFGENAKLHTLSEFFLKVLMSSPLFKPHSLIVPVPDPDAKYSPLGENATLLWQKEKN